MKAQNNKIIDTKIIVYIFLIFKVYILFLQFLLGLNMFPCFSFNGISGTIKTDGK